MILKKGMQTTNKCSIEKTKYLLGEKYDFEIFLFLRVYLGKNIQFYNIKDPAKDAVKPSAEAGEVLCQTVIPFVHNCCQKLQGHFKL